MAFRMGHSLLCGSLAREGMRWINSPQPTSLLQAGGKSPLLTRTMRRPPCTPPKPCIYAGLDALFQEALPMAAVANTQSWFAHRGRVVLTAFL
jgi:hypothetical protein